MSDVAISLPETLRDGRYVLGRMLGQGGMAVVVVARDTALNVDRAVKVLAPHGAHRQSLRRRLKAEARAMARLHHPNILAIHDVGTDDDLDWVVMDLATGGSLSDLQDKGPLNPWVAVGFMIQVLSALGAAHAQGIVHRDVKPHNVLLDPSGRALLADFGIALLATEDRRTRTGVAMGSIAYMPPEQRLDAARVGPSADLYAVGSTLFNLITGSNPVDLFLATERSERWNGVPDALGPILRRATRMVPDERYPDATSFAQALMEALRDSGTDLPTLHGMALSVVPGGDTLGAPTSAEPRPGPTVAPTTAAMDYLEERVPTVQAVDLPPLETSRLAPMAAPFEPATADRIDTLAVTEESPTTGPRAGWAPGVLLGIGAAALVLIGLWAWPTGRPLAVSAPTGPGVAASDLPTPPPTPVPETMVATDARAVAEPTPETTPAVEEEPIAITPAEVATRRPVIVAAPAPATRPAPPTDATTAVAGSWVGTIDRIVVTFDLGGTDADVEGTVTSRLSVGEATNSQSSRVVGRYDAPTGELRLEDASDERTHYTLSLDGDRMTGRIDRPGQRRVLVLQRVAG